MKIGNTGKPQIGSLFGCGYAPASDKKKLRTLQTLKGHQTSMISRETWAYLPAKKITELNVTNHCVRFWEFLSKKYFSCVKQ